MKKCRHHLRCSADKKYFGCFETTVLVSIIQIFDYRLGIRNPEHRFFCKYCYSDILICCNMYYLGYPEGQFHVEMALLKLFNVLLLLTTLQLLKRACCRFNAVAITHAVVCRDNTHCCSPNYGSAAAGRWWRDRFKRFVRVFV